MAELGLGVCVTLTSILRYSAMFQHTPWHSDIFRLWNVAKYHGVCPNIASSPKLAIDRLYEDLTRAAHLTFLLKFPLIKALIIRQTVYECPEKFTLYLKWILVVNSDRVVESHCQESNFAKTSVTIIECPPNRQYQIPCQHMLHLGWVDISWVQ